MRRTPALATLTLAVTALVPALPAHADLTCRGDDELSYADPDSTFFSKKDRDGDTWICVSVREKRDGSQQLRYYDDI